MRMLHCLETLGSIYPFLDHHIPEKWNPQGFVANITVAMFRVRESMFYLRVLIESWNLNVVIIEENFT
jgi:hypothetical protein